jgi:hypothetical protein
MKEQGARSREIVASIDGRDAWGPAAKGDDMTDDAGFKKAIRARMADTGEKYMQARRALLSLSAEHGTM